MRDPETIYQATVPVPAFYLRRRLSSLETPIAFPQKFRCLRRNIL